MTLSTDVAIRLPEGHTVTPKEMLDIAVKLLLEAAGETRDEILLDLEGETYCTVPGQGLPAWTFVHFRKDGPYTDHDITRQEDDPEYYAEAIEKGWVDADQGDELCLPACTFHLDFDTAYGYESVNGKGCTELHAHIIRLLQEWVAARSGSLIWKNEYAGTWHDFDDVEGWAGFLGNGFEAADWFSNCVKPAIENQMPGVKWV